MPSFSRRVWYVALALALILPSLALAESADPKAAPAKEAAKAPPPVEKPTWGKVIGWVLDARTRKPVEHARIAVELNGAFPESGKSTDDTDAQGRYEARAPLGKISSKLDWGRLLTMHPVSLLLAPNSIKKQTRIVDVTQVNVRVEADGYQPFEGHVHAMDVDPAHFSITLDDVWLAPRETKLASFTPERLRLEVIESLKIEPAIASPGDKVRITLAARLPVNRGFKYKAFATSTALRLVKDELDLKREGDTKHDKIAAAPEGEVSPRVVFSKEVVLPKVSQDQWAEIGFYLVRDGDTELRQRETKALLQVVHTPEERKAAEQVGDGFAAARVGEKTTALQAYSAAAKSAPSYALARLSYGDLCLQLNRPADAAAAYKPLADADPHDYEVARTRRAQALVEAGKPQEALAELAEAEKTLGKRVPARVYLYRARAYAALGNFDEADRNLAKAGAKIQIASDTVNGINLARMKAEVAAKPNNSDLRLSYARVLADNQRREEALQQIRKAAQLEPAQPWAYLDMGQLLAEMGRRAEGLANLRHALALAPENMEAQLALADVYRDGGQYAEALPLYHKVTETQKLNLRARHNYAILLYATGKLDEARQQFMEIIAQARAKGDLQEDGLMIPGASIYFGPKRRYVAGFSVPEATADYTIYEALQDLEQHPQSGLLWQNIGAALVDLNLPRLALSTLRKSAELQPDLLETRFLMGVAYRKLGQADEAQRELKAVIAANPLHPRARLELAQLYTDRGELEQAQAQILAHAKNWPYERPARPTQSLGG